MRTGISRSCSSAWAVGFCPPEIGLPEDSLRDSHWIILASEPIRGDLVPRNFDTTADNPPLFDLTSASGLSGTAIIERT